jgi:peptidylprolyl isomerase
MRRLLAAMTVAVAVLGGTAGCGGSSSGSSSSGIDGLTVTGSFGTQPTVKVSGLKVTGTKSSVLIKGDGPQLGANEKALLRFVIANGKNGKTLQSNYNDNQPASVDVAQQADPISKAIAGEPVGTRLEVALPAKLVVGDQGAPQVGLGPDDPLVMVVDLVDSALAGPKGTTVTPPADAPKVVEKGGLVSALDFSSAPKKAPKDFQVIPLVKGTGPAVKDGDSVNLQYVGTTWGNGDKPFDNSYGQPSPFTITKGGLIDGWVKGLVGVKVGSRVMLVIPPKLGYGAKGGGPGSNIPPNATLVFVIDVLGIGG